MIMSSLTSTFFYDQGQQDNRQRPTLTFYKAYEAETFLIKNEDLKNFKSALVWR